MTGANAIEDFDVAVIGGGGAGLAAAIEAASAGRKVILIEKELRLGGSTALSVGSITAAGTPQQRAAGIVDTPQSHFDDLDAVAGSLANRDNLALRRILVDNVSDAMTWLTGMGLEFAGPFPEPPHSRPRMHTVLPNSRAFPYILGRQCRRLGVDIRLGVRVERLLFQDGRVRGLIMRQDGEVKELHCRMGVVLASGDYSANAAMKREFASEEVARTEPVNPAATGEGFALALEHGAQIVNGDIVRGPLLRLVPPNDDTLLRRLPPSRMLARAMRWGAAHLPAGLLRRFTVAFFVTAVGPSPELFKTGAILVNSRGERFTDERLDPARAVAAQPDNMAYILLDNEIGRQFEAWPHYISTAPGVAYAYLDDYRRHRSDIFHRAPTLAALAALLGIPEAALTATVARRNATLTGSLAPIATGPFVALGPVRSYVVFTDGGLRITERCEVCGTDGRPIAGLFAAGSAGQGGILLPGHGHHLGWAFVSGRIAGRNAASNSPMTEAQVH